MLPQDEARPRATLSACIIAKDEQARLPACLDSVAFCDEIVVVDSGSRDATVALAREAGARVVEQPWLGFAGQRNVALDHAGGDWVLEIDADERVTPRLREEIEAFLAAVPAGIELAGLPLRDDFLGRRLGPSTKYPKYRHRMFKRDAYRHDESRAVHEGLTPHSEVHAFSGDLLHELAGSWSEALRDTWRYAALEARTLPPTRSPRELALGVLARPAAKFVFRTTALGGWRDGWQGLLRITLDCATDALVTLRRASGHGTGASVGGHYGRRARATGSPRVLAVASAAQAPAAIRWLEQARAAGCDVALVSDVARAGTVRLRHVARLGPFGLLRALDAEQQLRAYDLIAPFGRRARLLLRLVPGSLRAGTGTGEHAAREAALLRTLAGEAA